MKCSEIQELLSEYIDGELTEEQRRMVDEHVAECSDCAQVLESLKATVLLVNSLPEVKAPEGFAERVKRQVAALRPVAKPRLSLREIFFGARARFVIPAVAMVTAVLLFAVVIPRVQDASRTKSPEPSWDYDVGAFRAESSAGVGVDREGEDARPEVLFADSTEALDEISRDVAAAPEELNYRNEISKKGYYGKGGRVPTTEAKNLDAKAPAAPAAPESAPAEETERFSRGKGGRKIGASFKTKNGYVAGQDQQEKLGVSYRQGGKEDVAKALEGQQVIAKETETADMPQGAGQAVVTNEPEKPAQAEQDLNGRQPAGDSVDQQAEVATDPTSTFGVAQKREQNQLLRISNFYVYAEDLPEAQRIIESNLRTQNVRFSQLAKKDVPIRYESVMTNLSNTILVDELRKNKDIIVLTDEDMEQLKQQGASGLLVQEERIRKRIADKDNKEMDEIDRAYEEAEVEEDESELVQTILEVRHNRDLPEQYPAAKQQTESK